MIPQEPLSSTCILVRSLGVVVEMFIPIGAPATAEALPQSRTGPTRAQKRSDKAEMANSSHPFGRVNGWGGKYVEGGYEIDGHFLPLPGIYWA